MADSWTVNGKIPLVADSLNIVSPIDGRFPSYRRESDSLTSQVPIQLEAGSPTGEGRFPNYWRQVPRQLKAGSLTVGGRFPEYWRQVPRLLDVCYLTDGGRFPDC